MRDIWFSNTKKKKTKDENELFADASASDTKDRIESLNNDIYFYSEVNRSNNLTLNKKIIDLSNKYRNYSNSLGIDPANVPLRLHINSYGGSVFAGFSSVDYILNSKMPVHTIIDGCAASAATIMSVVGSHRQINKNAFMLIHQLSSISWGKFEELKDDMKNNEMLMKRIKNIYIQHTKIPKRKLAKILKHDVWWDAETCLKYGLVDEII